MRARAALASAAAVLLLLVDGCGCAMYKVGDLDAWGVPPPSKPDVYKRWAKSVHLALGDSIWFLYPPSQDSVLQVTPQAFAACEVSDPVLKLDDGNSVFNLTTPGRFYYTSGAPGHCRKGQKLWVDVPMANGTYLPPSANDLAALAPAAAEAPTGFLSASAPAGAHPSAALRPVAAAGSVVAAAALSFAASLLL
ncbi:early nodulin-like protein 8 [Phragmites australis]|uniref:early nodulin-like protein 8 n=1 Tax=Phragmites australis TaxID=29695 RepID=UPI002D7687D4|nr:early nodulin-like protein 8 [Phragmites australis]